jgi:hypothetical protein
MSAATPPLASDDLVAALRALAIRAEQIADELHVAGDVPGVDLHLLIGHLAGGLLSALTLLGEET